MVGVEAAETNRDIWVMNADGSGQTPIDTDPAHDINPDWGPNRNHARSAQAGGPRSSHPGVEG